MAKGKNGLVEPKAEADKTFDSVPKVEADKVTEHLEKVNDKVKPLLKKYHSLMLSVVKDSRCVVSSSRVSYFIKKLKFGSLWVSKRGFKVETITLAGKKNEYNYTKVTKETKFESLSEVMLKYIKDREAKATKTEKKEQPANEKARGNISTK